MNVYSTAWMNDEEFRQAKREVFDILNRHNISLSQAKCLLDWVLNDIANENVIRMEIETE